MIARPLFTVMTAGLVGISASAHAEKVVPVETLHGHPALFLDLDSIQHEGTTVSLTYILETPTGSNSIDAVIDCPARTVVTRGLRVQPETLPPGAVRTLPPEPPQPIKPKSTWDYLAKTVCK